MWRFVHISTLKKTPEAPKPIRRKPKGISMRVEKESICPPKKSHIFKIIIQFARESSSDCPFACQTATTLSALMSLLYRPHAHKRDISLIVTADFHASSRFFCRDFLGFLFVLPILEPSFFFVAGAACIGNRLYLQRFIFYARSADRDRICALFSTLTPNLSLFTAFSASNGEQPVECLRLFQVILIDVSRETRIFLAIFSINRATR